jgi:ubiquinone/menaquinone biosynthesis C-methylase UbiE
MLERFKIRSCEFERLDTGDYTAAEYARWHREMWFIHRIFGEMRALRNSLFRKIRADDDLKISILDVGAGSGELLAAIRKWTAGRSMFIAGAELNTDAVAAIRTNGIAAIQCDGLQLPFKDEAFDYVFCSLFLHHLTEVKAVELLREMSRVAKKQIFAIDLNRSPVAYYFYKIVGSLFLQRFTLKDGALSILRGFKREELLLLAREAGLENIHVARSWANRLILSGK